jgi:hypothetical protein
MGRVDVAHFIAIFCEHDDRRIRVAVGIFGVDGARKRRTIVRKKA